MADHHFSDLKGWRTFLLVLYNLMLSVVLCWQLVSALAKAPEAPPAPPPATAATPAPASPETPPVGQALVATLVTMTLAGGAGGTLCNLRGMFRWISDKGAFPARYETPFYVRPFTGAMTGLFVFFVGHLFVNALSAPSVHWRYLEGRLPYVGIAIVAGFAAQEFMQRLKAVAQTLFSESQPPVPPPAESASQDRK